jgi:hypothetical protein
VQIASLLAEISIYKAHKGVPRRALVFIKINKNQYGAHCYVNSR